MPKNTTTFIVQKYSDDKVKNDILSKEIFQKYSPCVSKFVSSTHTQKYISNKLDRAIRQIKSDKLDVQDVVNDKMIKDIWGALCPLKTDSYDIDAPKGLSKDIYELVDFKTKAYTSKYNNESESDSEAESSDEEVSKKSENQKSKSTAQKSKSITQKSKSITQKSKFTAQKSSDKKPMKKKNTKEKSESESESETSNSDSE